MNLSRIQGNSAHNKIGWVNKHLVKFRMINHVLKVSLQNKKVQVVLLNLSGTVISAESSVVQHLIYWNTGMKLIMP